MKNRGFRHPRWWVFVSIPGQVLLVATQSMATIDSVTVDPPQPLCDDEIVLTMTGSFSDQCWTIDFTTSGPVSGTTFLLTVVATDSWVPGFPCSIGEVPYEVTDTWGPLDEGSYEAVGEEIIQSERVVTGDTVFVPFDVCCDPAPPEVDGLLLEKLDSGASLRFTWNNVTAAIDYVMYEDLAADGAFENETGVVTSGVPGLTVPMPAESLYFLVAAGNGCREGPKR